MLEGGPVLTLQTTYATQVAMRIVKLDMRHEGSPTELSDVEVDDFTCPSSEAVNRHGVAIIKIERKSSSKLPPRTLDFQPHARSLPFISPSVAPLHESLERLVADGTARDRG